MIPIMNPITPTLTQISEWSSCEWASRRRPSPVISVRFVKDDK
jgi:hypothetical protein